jgi:hypothetical protein
MCVFVEGEVRPVRGGAGEECAVLDVCDRGVCAWLILYACISFEVCVHVGYRFAQGLGCERVRPGLVAQQHF